MTFYADLAPLNDPKLVTVGWLEPGHPVTQGDVSPEFISRLVDLLKSPWEPAVACGFHRCGFCRINTVPPSLQIGNNFVRMGVTNLYVPGDGRVYFAPSMIAHYIDAHGYAPPEEFQKAVVACPAMRSKEYYGAIKRNGPDGMLRT